MLICACNLHGLVRFDSTYTINTYDRTTFVIGNKVAELYHKRLIIHVRSRLKTF